MIEAIAIALSIGAIVFYTLHIGWGTLIFSLAILIVLLRFHRTIIILALACFIGAGVMAIHERNALQSVSGMRTIPVSVRSVDRRLQGMRMVAGAASGERFLIFLKQSFPLLPGDMITFKGMVEQPESFTTDSGRTFDYPGYLASKGVTAVMRDPYVIDMKPGGVSLARTGTRIRFFVAEVFSQFLTVPADGIISGMAVGYQGGIPTATEELFRETGVLHVLVLSGYNVTMLVGMLGVLLRRLPKSVRVIVMLIAILLLVVVSGAGVASVRAGLMGAIALVATLAIRSYDPLRALAIVYLCFFFHSPTSVFVDPGFHLSFLATGFMILVLPKVLPLFAWIRSNAIRELIALAVGVPLFMLPYTMYFAGTVPLAGPFANIIFGIVGSALTVSAFILLFLSWIPPIGALLGAIISTVTLLVIRALELLTTLPQLKTPPISWSVALGSYGLFFLLVFRKEIRKRFLPQQTTLPHVSN